jgi:hypothetical protein
LSDLVGDLATGADQIGHDPIVKVEDAFVLGPIPHVVALRQHSPDLRHQTKRVRQQLKNDVPVRRKPWCFRSSEYSGDAALAW